MGFFVSCVLSSAAFFFDMSTFFQAFLQFCRRCRFSIQIMVGKVVTSVESKFEQLSKTADF